MSLGAIASKGARSFTIRSERLSLRTVAPRSPGWPKRAACSLSGGQGPVASSQRERHRTREVRGHGPAQERLDEPVGEAGSREGDQRDRGTWALLPTDQLLEHRDPGPGRRDDAEERHRNARQRVAHLRVFVREVTRELVAHHLREGDVLPGEHLLHHRDQGRAIAELRALQQGEEHGKDGPARGVDLAEVVHELERRVASIGSVVGIDAPHPRAEPVGEALEIVRIAFEFVPGDGVDGRARFFTCRHAAPGRQASGGTPHALWANS